MTQMLRSEVSFVLRSSGFDYKEADGSTELYEMRGNNIFAQVVTEYGRSRKPVSTVIIFQKDYPLDLILARTISDLMSEINKHPVFKRIR